MKPMLVVRRLSAGVRGRCGCGQGQQKGARRLSSTTGSSSTNGAVYWGRQWEKAKEAAPVVVSVLGFGAVIAEGTRRQVEVGTKEAVLRGELEKKDVELRGELERKDVEMRGELEKKDAVLRGELEKKDVELEKKDAVLRGELEKKDAVLRGELRLLLLQHRILLLQLASQHRILLLQLASQHRLLLLQLASQHRLLLLQLHILFRQLASQHRILLLQLASQHRILRAHFHLSPSSFRNHCTKAEDAYHDGGCLLRLLPLPTPVHCTTCAATTSGARETASSLLLPMPAPASTSI